MMNTLMQHRGKFVAGFICLVAIVAFFVFGRRDELNISRNIDVHNVHRTPALLDGSYAEFLHNHSNTPWGSDEIEINLSSATGFGFSMEDFNGYPVLRTEEHSEVTFVIDIPVGGLFNLHMEYHPVPARGIYIARGVLINGEVPFIGAELMNFSRVWGSGSPVTQDNRGNQIRPTQVELPRWESVYFKDRLGFFAEPYMFYLQAGQNTITLIGVSEPLVKRAFTVTPVSALPTFAEFMQTTDLSPITSNFYAIVQGQDSTVRSSPSLFPLFDNSSGITNPPSASIITLNMIGGVPWRIPGQWIEWEVEVPQDGLYNLAFSARQSYNRGFVSSRSLTINGVAPFSEVEVIPFSFNNNWQLTILQDEQGNDLLFPLNAGVNTVRMEVTLGELGGMVDRLLASINRLNAIYREILVLTGPNPDTLRDYQIADRLPHVMVMIDEEIDTLYILLHDMIEFLGERNEYTAILGAIVHQLYTFYTRPNRIPIMLVNFQQNISALSNSARQIRETPLDIDFFVVSGTGANLPRVRENFVTRSIHEMRGFVASFTMDFDSIGQVHEGEDVIEVWIPTGRDQATIMKAMIDDSFTYTYGTGVNLRLIAHAALLPAVVAGVGPDVALSLFLNNPADYAFRNAVVDLSQFPDFEEVMTRFAPQTRTPFEFQGGYFAIPETHNFSLMFYRQDILNDLGIDVPRTWQEVLGIMPTLQRNNMAVGIPPVGDPMAPDISGFLTQLLQRGGALYNEDNSRTILDNEEAIAAFDAFTRFFTHFGSPQFYNFPNRFRSGEMPIGFADFTMFNLFSVFAPEIDGMWNFALMPGYMRPDGTIDHSVPAWGTGAVIFSASELQEESWSFLRWWTTTETQLRYARELESIMGAAARFPTANLEAFSRLPWTTDQLAVITEQREWSVSIPEIPGGYYVTRHLLNAIRRVINENVDTRETLLDFAIVINRELINKRIEFGLEER